MLPFAICFFSQHYFMRSVHIAAISSGSFLSWLAIVSRHENEITYLNTKEHDGLPEYFPITCVAVMNILVHNFCVHVYF